MEATAWKCACGVLAVGLTFVSISVRAAEDPGPLRATSLEIVDGRGRVRWRIEGEYPNTHRPKLTLLDERGKERVEMTLAGGVEEPTMTFLDGVAGRPLMMLELDSATGRPNLSMLSMQGQATCCVQLTTQEVDGTLPDKAGAKVNVGALRLMGSDGSLSEIK